MCFGVVLFFLRLFHPVSGFFLMCHLPSLQFFFSFQHLPQLSSNRSMSSIVESWLKSFISPQAYKVCCPLFCCQSPKSCAPVSSKTIPLRKGSSPPPSRSPRSRHPHQNSSHRRNRAAARFEGLWVREGALRNDFGLCRISQIPSSCPRNVFYPHLRKTLTGFYPKCVASARVGFTHSNLFHTLPPLTDMSPPPHVGLTAS